jgi:hypothetical protein
MNETMKVNAKNDEYELVEQATKEIRILLSEQVIKCQKCFPAN